MKSDEQLLREYLGFQSKADRDDAFRQLADRYAGMVYGVCIRSTGENRVLAEDAAQATFIILARKARTIRDRTSLSSWLYGVARRTSFGAVRGEKRRKAREQSAMSDFHETHDQRRQQEEMMDSTIKAVERLTPKLQAVILLHFVEGLTYAETASVLSCSESAVEKRISRALKILRRKVQLPEGAACSSLLGATLPLQLHASVSESLATVCQSAGALASGSSSAASLFLAKETIKMMTLVKVKLGVGIATVVGVVAISGGIAVRGNLFAGEKSPDFEKPTGGGSAVAKTVTKSPKKKTGLQAKLKKIIIPQLVMQDTPVTTVFEYLKNRSRTLDPDGVGVNFLTVVEPAKEDPNWVEPTITMRFDNDVPLSDVVRFICEAAKLKYVVDDDAVVVFHNSRTAAWKAAVAAREKAASGRIRAIVFTKVSFKETPVSTVFEYLKGEDERPLGVNFILSPKLKKHTVTMDLDAIPLDSLIHYACFQAGVQYKIEKDAVRIFQADGKK